MIDGTGISSTATITSNDATTVYVAGWYYGQYNPSDAASDSVEERQSPLVSWKTINLTETNSELKGIAYGNGYYLLSYGNATLCKTTDFNSFSATTEEAGGALAFGNGVFVLRGSRTVLISGDNGDTWTEIEQKSDIRNTESLMFVNGLFYAFDTIDVYTSTNGSQWTLNNYTLDGSSDAPILSDNSRVVYSDGYFYAIYVETYGVLEHIVRSSNGYTWTTYATLQSDTNANYYLGGVIDGKVVVFRSFSNTNAVEIGTIYPESATWVDSGCTITQDLESRCSGAGDSEYLALVIQQANNANSCKYTQNGTSFIPMDSLPDGSDKAYEDVCYVNGHFFMLSYHDSGYHMYMTN